MDYTKITPWAAMNSSGLGTGSILDKLNTTNPDQLAGLTAKLKSANPFTNTSATLRGGLLKDFGKGVVGGLNKFGESLNIGGVGGLVTAGLGLFDTAQIEDKTQRKIGMADAGVDAVSAGLSFIPGFGTAAGAALKLVNGIGGKLIKTPNAAKQYAVNDEVARSGAMTGIASNANNTNSTVGAYKGAGLIGKLFGKKDMVGAVSKSNTLMNMGQAVLNQNKAALDQATTSSNMFSTRTSMIQDGGNDVYNNIRYGKKGGKLSKFLLETKKLQQGGKVTLVEATKRYATEKEKEVWTKFLEFVKKQSPTGVSDNGEGINSENWSVFENANKTGYRFEDIMPIIKNTIDANQQIDITKLNGETPNLDVNNINFNEKFYQKVKSLNKSMEKPEDKPNFNVTPLPDEPEEIDDSNPFEEESETNKKAELFQKGGVLKKNVIVSGALHARKHDLKSVKGYEDAEITTKGVPVITQNADGGSIQQHAEVECEEIIFNLETTKKLEKLMKDGSDEAKIEAGKLLVKEILSNTQDKSGLIKSID